MTRIEGITVDPKVMLGKPVIEGTRVTVESVLERLGSGDSVEEIADSHPRLTSEKVRAAVRYAALVLNMDEVYPSASRPS